MPRSRDRIAAHVFLLAACGATALEPLGAQRPARAPPVLTAFAINDAAESVTIDDATVTLTHAVVGTRPSEYRVSRRADFADARWLRYVDALIVRDWYASDGGPCESGNSAHVVTLFLQVRATIGEEVRVVNGQRQLVPIHAESNVLRDTICVRVVPDE